MAMKNKNKNKKIDQSTIRTFTSGSKAALKKEVDHSKFTNKDGYLVGGIEIQMSNPQETQVEEVQGQGNILTEKKRLAKWY